MFELKFNVKSGLTVYKKETAAVYFAEQSDLSGNIRNIEMSSSVNFPDVVKKKIGGKDEKSVMFYSDSEPVINYLFKYDRQKITSDFFRNAIAGVIPGLFNEKVSSLEIFVPDYDLLKNVFESEEYYFQSVIEGVGLGNYEFDKYKSDKNKKTKLNVNFNTSSTTAFKNAIKISENILDAVYFTRDIINEPAITLTPDTLAKSTKKLFSKSDVKLTVWDKKELKNRKMNAILAVGGASSNDPRFIILEYKCGKKKAPTIALVGKGVTYDSGGLSIKPTSGMFDMKTDMAGAASVIGAVYAASANKLNVDITGIIPAVENMVSGSSYKPGDIIKSFSGKTIEVMDTDAEGRIILADALHYASLRKPDEIIDLATLTGACVVALGEYAAGMFTKSDAMAETLSKAGYDTYERVWRLPIWDEYADLIKSDIADVANLGPRWGGAITAAKFLENFVKDPEKWVHLDLAPSGKNKLCSYTEKYHPGFGIRLLYKYLEMKQAN